MNAVSVLCEGIGIGLSFLLATVRKWMRVFILFYGKETLTRYEYDKSRMKAVGMDFVRTELWYEKDWLNKESNSTKFA